MSGHDPLCPWLKALSLPEHFPDLGGRVRIPEAETCDYEPLIAQVRADERKKVLASSWVDLVADEREQIAQAIEEMRVLRTSPKQPTTYQTGHMDGWRNGIDTAARLARNGGTP